MSRYPLVPLGEVLTLDIDEQVVDSAAEYDVAGVYSFGRGLFARAPLAGSATSYRKLHRLHAGTLVLSRLKAFEGAVAVVPHEYAGSFLSSEFPTFSCDPKRLVSAYLGHLCRWPAFWDLLSGSSKGIGARRERVHPEQLLAIEVPLPNIEEQRRVAAKLDAIACRTRSITERSTTTTTLANALPASLAQRHDLSYATKQQAGWLRLPLGAVMTEVSDMRTVESIETYPNVGVLSFGRGLFEKPPIDGSTTSAKKLNRIRAGQFIYSRLFAFEGAYASVPERFTGHFVSGEFPTFALDESHLLAQYLAARLRSEHAWADLAGSSKGLGVRRQRIHAGSLLAYEIWVPPLKYQRQVVRQLKHLEQAAQLRERTAELTTALEGSALNQAFAGLL